jgi:hypothetical protein
MKKGSNSRLLDSSRGQKKNTFAFAWNLSEFSNVYPWWSHRFKGNQLSQRELLTLRKGNNTML